MLSAMTHVGAGNVAFVEEYIRHEGLSLVGSDVGGECSRKIRFYPKTGRVQLRRIGYMRNETVRTREAAYMKQLEQPSYGGAELF